MATGVGQAETAGKAAGATPGRGAAPAVTPEDIFREATLARPRIAWIEKPTPVDRVPLPGGGAALVKREDMSRVHSFKWRGAANKIASMAAKGRRGPIVASSAGNHAQGVALAAASYGIDATIFMPRTTPAVKLDAVAELGGERVEIVLAGDRYDESAAAAHRFCAERRAEGAEFVHPYDDPMVIAGAGTIADEIVQQAPKPGRVYVAVGGGGLAAGVAAVLKAHWPDVPVFGVEAEGQHSMSAALRAGRPVDIGPADRFCDGTAVREVGAHTFRLCAGLLDGVVVVPNDEVCAAIEFFWRRLRTIPEPSGALGMAAVLRNPPGPDDPPALTVLCGANADFQTIPVFARRSHIGLHVRRYFEFTIGERPGSLVEVLEAIGDRYNIVDFQHGKTHGSVAHPVIGLEAPREAIDRLGAIVAEAGRALGVAARDVTGQLGVDYRIIPVRPDLFRAPVFAKITFPDRGGALREFMHAIGATASICYFNFASAGRTEGDAVMGFEFADPADRPRFLAVLAACGHPHQILGENETTFHAAMNGAATPRPETRP